MRHAALVAVAVLVSGCPAAPYTIKYAGDSDAEQRLLARSRRDVYPNDVRARPDSFRGATLAWPGIVVVARPDLGNALITEVVIQHHYWDWMEDHSIQKAKAFLSPRGEGEFVCHTDSRLVPRDDFRRDMAVAYVRPLGMKDGRLHAACVLHLFPPEWYATDVFDYGRDGEGLKVLRVPME